MKLLLHHNDAKFIIEQDSFLKYKAEKKRTVFCYRFDNIQYNESYSYILSMSNPI